MDSEERRRDLDLRAEIDAYRAECADVRAWLEQSQADRADLRRRGRSLKRGFVLLSTLLVVLATFGFVELRVAIDRISQNREAVLRSNCEGHDRFVNGYSAAIEKMLSDPVELRRRAQRDGVLVADEMARLRASRAATIRLVDALQPRNPKDPGDHRSCAVIAHSLR